MPKSEIEFVKAWRFAPSVCLKENGFIIEALFISILRVTYICDNSLNGCKGYFCLFICLLCFLTVFLIFKLISISYKFLLIPEVHLQVFTYFVIPGLTITFKFTEARTHRTPIYLKKINGYK